MESLVGRHGRNLHLSHASILVSVFVSRILQITNSTTCMHSKNPIGRIAAAKQILDDVNFRCCRLLLIQVSQVIIARLRAPSDFPTPSSPTVH